MADIKWIKITTDIFDDEKILLIESMPEADSILVIWFKLLSLAGKQNNGGIFILKDKIPYTAEMFSTLFRRPLNVVKLALKTFEEFGMVEVVNATYTLPNWEKHQNVDGMDKVREQTRKRVAEYREKQKALLSSNVTVTLHNADVTQQNKNKNKIKNKNNIISSSNNARAREVYQSYEENIGALTGMIFEELEGYTELMCSEAVIYAIKQAALNNKKSCSYVKRICQNLLNEGVKTPLDLERHIERWEEQKQQRKSQQPEASLEEQMIRYGGI